MELTRYFLQKKISTRLYARAVRRTLLLLVACLSISLSSSVFAGTLQGLVLNSQGVPLAHVRIDFSGPTQHTTVTDARGQFRVTGLGGSYRVRFSNQQRREEQKVAIPESSVKSHNFQLAW